MFPSIPSKPGRTMRQRIQRVLDRGPVKGQIELGNEVLGKNWSLEDWMEFTDTLRSMLVEPPEVKETRTQLPSTGLDGPPVFEYTYSALSNK